MSPHICRTAVVAFCLVATIATAQDQSGGIGEAAITQAIKDLGNVNFRTRQSAQQILVAAGTDAIDALENGAKADQLEVATRCVRALLQITNQAENANVLHALERLAADPSLRISEEAAWIVTDLKMTDEERAIAALEADGIQIFRGHKGDVLSIRVTHDRQVGLLKYLPTLKFCSLTGKEVTDVGMQHLVEVKSINQLSLHGCSVTDVGLRQLSGLPNLDHLRLSGDKFTSNGLRQLNRIPKLRSLSIRTTADESKLLALADLPQISSLSLSLEQLDEQLIDLVGRLPHLTMLSLSFRKIDDEQIACLNRIDVPLSLTVMSSPGFTDQGLEHLREKQLSSLMLFGTSITDAGMVHIGSMKSLQTLSIVKSPISDSGLEHLEEQTALRYLYLHDTKVTNEGVKQLQASLPKLQHVNLR